MDPVTLMAILWTGLKVSIINYVKPSSELKKTVGAKEASETCGRLEREEKLGGLSSKDWRVDEMLASQEGKPLEPYFMEHA